MNRCLDCGTLFECGLKRCPSCLSSRCRAVQVSPAARKQAFEVKRQ